MRDARKAKGDMMKIVSVEEMRRIERDTDAGGQSYAAMMDMAGRAVARAASELMALRPESAILILVGPGNNGGDGLVAARYLAIEGYLITVYVWKRNTKGDEPFRRLKRVRRGLTILWADNDPDGTKLREELRTTDLVIDSLLGTGSTRPIEGSLATMLSTAREEIQKRRAAAIGPDPDESWGLPSFPLLEAYALGARRDRESKPEPWGDDELDDFYEMDDADDADAMDNEMPEGLEEPGDELVDWEDEDDDDQPWRPSWPQPPVLAVDCPSGLNCDSGALDPEALRAEVTVTFAYPKWGQVQYPGAGACGLLGVVDIGVPARLTEELQTELVQPGGVRRRLPPRPDDAHKGTFGKAMIVGGSVSYTGAAYLAAAAATRAGAGLVTLAIPLSCHAPLAGALPQVTWLVLPEADGTHSAAGAERLAANLEGYDALVVGPGLTTSDGAKEFVETLFGIGGLEQARWRSRTVVDADALNIMATLEDWPGRLPPGSILTPHPGEMARLTGTTTNEVNATRITTARYWAAAWGHVVLLKGPHTAIGAPDGRVAVLPFAVSTLATAGSGDVLAGTIGAMLAQGLAPFDAAICGGYLHGHAGVRIARSDIRAGVVAGDLVAQLPEALRDLMMDPSTV